MRLISETQKIHAAVEISRAHRKRVLQLDRVLRKLLGTTKLRARLNFTNDAARGPSWRRGHVCFSSDANGGGSAPRRLPYSSIPLSMRRGRSKAVQPSLSG